MTIPNTNQLQTALALLHGNARPQELAGMARFGIVGDGRLGQGFCRLGCV